MLPTSTKTEHRALNALESIIDDHPTMDHDFKSQDKEMSWDGFIVLYKDNKTQSKSNFDSRVPVQIKGHYDLKNKYYGKETITYSVEIDDLKAYATEKGVLYFQIFIIGQKREIYYSSLYPSKIADYLERAKKKGNKKTFCIQFNRLKKTVDALYSIVKQFDFESKNQGSAYTPIVQNRIKSSEYKKLKEIHMNVFGAEDFVSALKRLASGDICIRGITNDDQYERPIEWHDHSIFSGAGLIQMPICIGDEVYYSQFHCLADSNGKLIVKPSQNLEIDLRQEKLNYQPKTTIKEMAKDAQFLLALKESGSFRIGDHETNYNNLSFASDFEASLRYTVELYKTLEMIDFDTDISVSEYTEEQKRQFMQLVNLKNGLYNERFTDEVSRCMWMFGDKNAPLLVVKKDAHIEVYNAVYTDKMVVFLPYIMDGQDKGYRMPLFIYQEASILCNLYYYDFDAFKAQIDNSDINQNTFAAMIECVLKMISVFDINGDERFLDLADYLLDKLQGIGDRVLVLLNRMQIKKRRGKLAPDDIIALQQIEDDSISIQFGKSVLLGDKQMAEKCFALFTEEMKEQFRSYPIYRLFADEKEEIR